MVPAEIRDELETLLAPRGFRLHSFTGPDQKAMGAWHIELRSPSVIVTASQDRTGDVMAVCVGTLARRAPLKQMRGPWPLSHLRGFLERKAAHHRFDGVSDQLDWLRQTLDRILDPEMLNSDQLNDWAVAASRMLFAHDRHTGG